MRLKPLQNNAAADKKETLLQIATGFGGSVRRLPVSWQTPPFDIECATLIISRLKPDFHPKFLPTLKSTASFNFPVGGL